MMNRSPFILGFTLLVIAATWVVSITLRNTPSNLLQPDADLPRQAHPHTLAKPTGAPVASKTLSQRVQATHKSDALRVALPEPWLTTLPPEQQVEWRARAAAVEGAARKKLDRLTHELELTSTQRDKMFPLIVRSTQGYDPVMLTGGNLTAKAPLAAKTPLAADEEIHQVLDPQQQALVEDQEVNRQLWWQDTLSRLEADLIDSTGGVTATIAASPTEIPTETTTTPAATMPATEERVAPAARENGNLFDLLDP